MKIAPLVDVKARFSAHLEAAKAVRYDLGIVFIRFVGTHQYDSVDVLTVQALEASHGDPTHPHRGRS